MSSENKAIKSDILCIEDNAAFVYALRALVDNRVVAAETLSDGFAKMDQRPWHKVVLDLVLPDSDIEDTIRMIPTIKERAKADVIVMSGYPVNRKRLMALGASEVVDKMDPAFPGILMRALL